MTRAQLSAIEQDIEQRIERSIAAAVTKAVADRDQKIDELTKRIDELEKEPDPGKAPFRGTSVVVATPDAERPSALKAAQERDEAEQVAQLEQMASNHPDPDMRRRATGALARKQEVRREASGKTQEV